MAKLRILRKLGARLRGKFRVGQADEDAAIQPPDFQIDSSQITVDEVPEDVVEEKIYEYLPLDRSSESTFRLLTLLPGPKGSQPCCTLSISTWRDRNCPYEALSYVWGDSRTTKPIVLDGKVFEVRENLYSALSQLQFETHPRVLWVDAICIDQNSINERNHQVASMGHIYSSCQKVLVWLGEEDGNTESVVRFIESTFDEIEQNIPGGPRYRNWSDILELHNASIQDSILQELLRPELKQGWASFQSHVLRRTWWNRAWVVQEYANAPEATFYIGGFTIPWNAISALIIVLFDARFLRTESGDSLLKRVDSRIVKTALNITRIRAAKQAKNAKKKPGSSDRAAPSPDFIFIAFLRSQSRQRCQDPKDKVYSILSMVDETISASLSPDYSMSTVSTYVGAIKAYINVSQKLDILATDQNESTSSFPSWCPNWNMEPFCSRITMSTKGAIHEASGKTEANVTFSREESTMYVKGLFVCTITSDCYQDSTEDMTYTDEHGVIHCSWDLNYMAQKLRRSGASWDSGSTSNAELEEGQKAFTVVTTALVAGFWSNAMLESLVKKDMVNGEWRPGGKNDQFLLEAADRTRNRTVVLTDHGNLGIASKKTKIGDEVWIFLGASLPFILRKTDEMDGTRQVRRFIAPAYVHGIMEGEAMEDLEKGKYKLETVALR